MLRFRAPLFLCLALAAPAAAQNYALSVTSRSFSSIAGTGTALTLSNADDGTGSFTSPFAMDLFGAPLPAGSTVYVSTNGTITLDVAYDGYQNTAIPTSASPNAFLAPFWDDLNLSSGTIYWQSQGSVGSRTLVVEWSNAAHYSATADSFSFQARYSELSDTIEFVYGGRVAGSTGWSGTIGLENLDGSYGVSHTCAISAGCVPADVPSGTALVFTPSTTPPPMNVDLVAFITSSVPSTLNPGNAITVDFEIDNNGTAASGPSVAGLYAGLSSAVTTSDYLLTTVSVPAVAAGSYYLGSFNGTVPNLSGFYYLAVIADAQSSVMETNEANNASQASGVTIQPGGGGITVTTNQLSQARVGQPYSAQLSATGGNGSYYWSLVSGSLPSGITLSEVGSIAGTAGVAGSSTFTVECTDFTNTPGRATLTLVVTGGGGSPVLTTTTLPPAIVNAPYSAMLEASGGAPPYGFQVIQGKPAWLSVASDGRLSGTPDNPGAFDMVVSIFDSDSQSGTGTARLEVTMPTALALVSELPGGVVGTAYDAAVVTGGVPPYTIMVTQGTLPAGLSFDNRGHLVGTPGAPANVRLGLTVTDGDSPAHMVQGEIPLQVIMRSALAVDLSDQLIVYVNADANVMLQARGGVPPYTWSLVSGALQNGLVLNSSGTITGKVTRASTATVTLGVMDSEGAAATKEVHVRATAYRSGNNGGGNERDSGCGCRVEPAGEGALPSAVAWMALGLFAFLPRFGRKGRCRTTADYDARRSSGPSGPPAGDRSSS